MNVHDVSRWKRCEELAKEAEVTIKLKRGFELTDKKGNMLGVIETVSEVFHFLCGYDYYVRYYNLLKKIGSKEDRSNYMTEGKTKGVMSNLLKDRNDIPERPKSPPPKQRLG